MLGCMFGDSIVFVVYSFLFCLLVPMAWANTGLDWAYVRARFPFWVSKEGIVKFLELKMLKLRPLFVYNNCNGWRSIRTSYFPGKSEVWLVTVIAGNAEVYTTVVFSRFRRVERTNLVFWEKELCWLKYSIGHKSTCDDSLDKVWLLGL